MITQGTKAALLRDGDEVFTAEGRMTISNIKMVIVENIITYTATMNKCGTASRRWADMDSIVNKVIDG